jgi:hypothetical protein
MANRLPSRPPRPLTAEQRAHQVEVQLVLAEGRAAREQQARDRHAQRLARDEAELARWRP